MSHKSSGAKGAARQIKGTVYGACGKSAGRSEERSDAGVKRCDTCKDSGGAGKIPGAGEALSGKRHGWSSRSVGSKLGHSIFYLFIRIAGRLPAYGLLAVVVSYYVVFSPSARKKAGHYLKRRFPAANPLQRFFQTYRMIFNLGTALVDRAAAGILGPETLDGSFSGGEKLEEIIRSKKGFILMMSHVGCWQVAISSLGGMETPINMLMQNEEGDIDRHYFEHSGEAMPYRVIDPRGYLGGALEMMDVLKRGECLCVMGDRVMGSARNLIEVPFLGQKAVFPVSAFKIASAVGVPIVVVFSNKIGKSSYCMDLAEVICVPPGLGRKVENFRPHVETYVRALEGYCMSHPFQFFNFFDMWEKESVEGGAREGGEGKADR